MSINNSLLIIVYYSFNIEPENRKNVVFRLFSDFPHNNRQELKKWHPENSTYGDQLDQLYEIGVKKHHLNYDFNKVTS